MSNECQRKINIGKKIKKIKYYYHFLKINLRLICSKETGLLTMKTRVMNLNLSLGTS